MEELNKRNYYLHPQINLLLKWSITMRAEQKNASRQLFKDIWLFDIELLHRYHQPAQRSLLQCLHSRHHYPRCSLELRCLLSNGLVIVLQEAHANNAIHFVHVARGIMCIDMRHYLLIRLATLGNEKKNGVFLCHSTRLHYLSYNKHHLACFF